MPNKANRQALRLAAIYVGVAASWIFVSGQLLRWLVKDADLRIDLQILKGWAFVLVTGGLLYLAVRRLLKSGEQEAARCAQAEAARAHSHERYKLIERAVNDGLWDWNLVTGEDLFSPRWKEIVGYKDNELPNLRTAFEGLLHPEDRAKVEQATSACLEKGERYAIEYRLRHKDGSWRWLFSRAEAVRDSSGRPLRLVGAVTDITDRKRAEEALRGDAEKFSKMFRASPVPVTLSTMNEGRYLDVNEEFLRLVERPREEVVGHTAIEVGVWADPAARNPIIARIRESGSVRNVEVAIRTGTGQIKYILWSAEVTVIGDETCLLGTSADITDRKGAEQAIRESEARYRQLFELESDAMLLVDGETHRLMEANQSAQRLYGYSLEELLQLKAEDLSAEPERTRQVLASGNYTTPLRWHRKKNGERFAVEVTANIIQHRGRVSEITAIRDITARLKAEQSLRENEERFRLLWTQSEDAIRLTDINGLVVMANPAYCRLMERTVEAVQGHPMCDVYLPESRANILADHRTSFEAHVTKTRTETQVTLWNGKVLWLEVSISFLEQPGAESLLLALLRNVTKRKDAERALRESEERLRLYVEHIPAAVAMFDRQMNYLVASHSWIESNRFPDRSFIGRSHYELVPDIPQRWKEIHQRCLAGAIHKCDADPFVRANGETEWIRWEVRPWHHADGSIGGIIVFYEDITERRRAAESLRASEELLRFVTENAQVGLVMVNRERSYTYANAAYARFIGQPMESIIGRRVADVLEAEYEGQIRPRLDRAFAGERVTYELKRRIARQDRYFATTYQPMSMAGLDTVVLAVITDITERKRAEGQLKVQSSAMAATANAIVITDRNGAIEWVNPAFTKFTGYSAEEAIGKNPRVLKSGQHPCAYYANLWATVLAGKTWRGEFINRRKDGQLYTEEATITPVRDADGQVTHFVAIKLDTTEQRQMEKRMQQAQKMEAIGTLAGGIAHDFNNILAAMFGYAYLVQQDTQDNPSAQENIEEILKAAGRAKDLVQQILTFSRQREQKPQVIQLEMTVKEAVKFLRASLPAQIKIEMNLHAETPSVLADPTQIYQVTLNLATNALHAMEGRPGQLTIALEPFQPEARFLESHPEFRPTLYARLTVADTGHGMDAPTLERIFEPFFTTKPQGKGTGLGLAVVHGIVQANHGAITVESEVGRGTTFCLYFPRAQNEAVAAVAPDLTVATGTGQKILLLDDEPALTVAMQRLLVRLNYRVVTSNSAREAVGWCRQDPSQFDLVITDLTMPEMNGLEVARQLHALRPDLSVILASGASAELTREVLDGAGVAQFIEKPITRAVLADVVHRVLAGHNGQAVVPPS